MSEQMMDPFKWNKKEYVFLAARNVYALFDPEKYGLEPDAPHTACYKGFIVHFSVRKNQLYLDKLEVNCDNGIYPVINGVKAKKKWHGDFRIYHKLKMPLMYTGTIIIGQHFNEHFEERAFIGPHCYDITYELEFKEGMLLNYKETSGIYHGF